MERRSTNSVRKVAGSAFKSTGQTPSWRTAHTVLPANRRPPPPSLHHSKNSACALRAAADYAARDRVRSMARARRPGRTKSARGCTGAGRWRGGGWRAAAPGVGSRLGATGRADRRPSSPRPCAQAAGTANRRRAAHFGAPRVPTEIARAIGATKLVALQGVQKAQVQIGVEARAGARQIRVHAQRQRRERWRQHIASVIACRAPVPARRPTDWTTTTWWSAAESRPLAAQHSPPRPQRTAPPPAAK